MSYQLIEETKPKARKPHRCIWCGQQIEVGETYLREKSSYDQNLQDHKWHLECNAAAREEHAGEYEWELDPWDNERPGKRLGFNGNVERRHPTSDGK